MLSTKKANSNVKNKLTHKNPQNALLYIKIKTTSNWSSKHHYNETNFPLPSLGLSLPIYRCWSSAALSFLFSTKSPGLRWANATQLDLPH